MALTTKDGYEYYNISIAKGKGARNETLNGKGLLLSEFAHIIGILEF